MSLVDTATSVYNLAKKGMTIDLQEKVMELRQDALEMEEENLRLRTENIELKKQIELRETLAYKSKLYWRDGDGTPFCPYCYEKSKLLIHMDGPYTDGQFMEYRCQECLFEYAAHIPTDGEFRCRGRSPM